MYPEDTFYPVEATCKWQHARGLAIPTSELSNPPALIDLFSKHLEWISAYLVNAEAFDVRFENNPDFPDRICVVLRWNNKEGHLNVCQLTTEP